MLKMVADDFAYILKADEISQDIEYKKYTSGDKLQLKGVLEFRDFQSDGSEGRIVVDKAVCFVSIEFVPTIYDEIKVNDEVYKVVAFAKQGLGSRYKLSLEMNKRPSNSHTQGRYR